MRFVHLSSVHFETHCQLAKDPYFMRFAHLSSDHFGDLSTCERPIFHEVYSYVHLETHYDLAKDPYFGDNLNLYRNHLGTYECKLCLTLHNNEASYLAHTQACDGDDDHNNYEDDNISSTLIFRARSTRATWQGEPPRKLLMLLSSLHHRNRWRWNWNILLK